MKKKPPLPQKPALVLGEDLKKYFIDHVEEIPARPGFYKVTKPLHVFKFAWGRHGSGRVIVNLVIPVGAEVFAKDSCFYGPHWGNEPAGFRKMRASRALVHSIADQKTGKPKKGAHSDADPRFQYVVGGLVKPTNGRFDSQPSVCSTGIHFFLNLADAMEYY